MNKEEYIRKLIAEIREDMKKNMVMVDGDLCCTDDDINVALLCDTVEELIGR